MPGRPAVFLDRDGTLNVERCYLTRPEDLQLLPNVAVALQLLKAAGYACVVVTNQSAVARGMMTDDDLRIVHRELERQLAEKSVVLDGIYACTSAVDHPDRKPAPGLLLRAAADLQLDLTQSWMIGDRLRDVLAGQNAGCRGCILVQTGHPIEESEMLPTDPFQTVEDLLAAARHILQIEKGKVQVA